MVTAFAPLRRLEGATELLDQAGHADAELHENLRDLERLNRLFGGTRAVLRHLARVCAGALPGPLAILDVGTGGADIPRAICRWARARGAAVTVEAVDRSEQVLRAAADWSAPYPEVRLRLARVPPLSCRDRSFDCVVASLMLHHLSRAEGVHLLREMARVARRRVIVSDLARSRRAHLLTAIGTRLLSRNRLTRHDGPLSVLRGFRPQELLDMAAEAGLRDARLHRHPWFRLVLVADAGPTPL